MSVRLAASICVAAFAAYPASSTAGAADVFEQLKSLAGEWEADLPGFGKLTSSVRLVSNGKAIEETIGTPQNNEISVYTLSGDRILLMHYCAMTPDGHQVRLETSKLEDTPERLNFRLLGTTNLRSRAAPHMRHVVMTIIDRDHYTENWTKAENGKDTVFGLSFVRSPSKDGKM